MVTRNRHGRRRAAKLQAPEGLEQRRVLAAVLSMQGPTEPLIEGERADFTLQLSERSSRAETVFITTQQASATLGVDYAAPNVRQVIFAPGETVKRFTIATLAEAVPRTEGPEVFYVTATPANPQLSPPLTRPVVIGDAVPRPVISVANIVVNEGFSGTTPATFTLTLSSAYPRPVTVAYATRDGSATVADSDYTAASGRVTFLPGQTSQTVSVNVTGDRFLEPDETFLLVLSSPKNATLGRGTATCTIRNDEIDAPGFQITVNYLTPMQPAWTRAVQRAVAKWESVIVGDVPNVIYQGQFIDDFEIDVTFERLPPNVLGGANFTEQREGAGGLPFYGEMTMNSLYANLPGIYDTIVHELGHALGFTPELWDQLGLFGGTPADPRFLGSNAIREFNSTFSTTAAGVPLYEIGRPGDGSYGAHWRDSVFGNEMMVSAGDPGVTNIPLSRITVAQFADIGYQVNYTAADRYRPPANRVAVSTNAVAVMPGAWALFGNRPLTHTVSRPPDVGMPQTGAGSNTSTTTKPRPVATPLPPNVNQLPAAIATRPTTVKSGRPATNLSMVKVSLGWI